MKKSLISSNYFFDSVLSRIERNSRIDSNDLAFLRVFSGLFFLIYWTPNFDWIGEFPDTFFRPDFFNFTNLFEGWFPTWFFIASDHVLIVCLFFIIVGFYTRISLRIFSALLILNNAFLYSFGKIDHAILVPLFYILLSFTNSGTKFCIVKDERVDSENFSIALIAICIVFGYFSAGFEKLFSWVDFNLETSGFLSWLLVCYFETGKNQFLATYFLDLNPIIYEIMDYSAVLMEVSGVIFLFYSRRSWLTYLLILSFFHLGTALTLNISFYPHIIIFSGWLLFPLFKKLPILYVLFFLPLLFSGLNREILLWVITIIIGMINFTRIGSDS